MGFIRWINNTLYACNPFPTDYVLEPEINDELPLLPETVFADLTHASSFRLGPKHQRDPRFPIGNSNWLQRCHLNFSVWRKCLETFSETMDETDPNANICRYYKLMAHDTCPYSDWKALNASHEKDNFIGFAGFRSRRPDANPTLVIMDDQHIIQEVLRPNSKDPKNWKPGDKLRY
ncbi:Cox6b2 [Acrasis kona]|uniref:Cox6b2 n=1 Tax=Acrasis kona TaxID=1008807 RepID=A0AAW2YJF0_9EUKA